MSCECGDTHCGSCGPAQGNQSCEACGVWLDDDPPETPRGNAIVLVSLLDFLTSAFCCNCSLCTTARSMLPCEDPEDCAETIRKMREQEERFALDEQMSDEEYEAACREHEEDERSSEEFWFGPGGEDEPDDADDDVEF